jgi:hypothetical protein
MAEATAVVMGPPTSGGGAGGSASVSQVTQQLAQMSSPRPRPAPDDETEVEMLRRMLKAQTRELASSRAETEQVRTRRHDRDARREGEEVRSTTSSTQQRREAGSQPAITPAGPARPPGRAPANGMHWARVRRNLFEELF